VSQPQTVDTPAADGLAGSQFGGVQVEVVVEGVDDVEHAAVVRPVPAAEELGETGQLRRRRLGHSHGR
jgi:hypothetical protein